MIALLPEAAQSLTAIDELAARARDYADRSQADSTRRAYASDLRDFYRFCSTIDAAALPATPQTVALYVTELAAIVKVSTIRRRLSAVSVLHRRASLDSPCSHRVVRDVLQGISREKGTATRRVSAITVGVLRSLLLAVEGDDVAAKRDRAILLIGFAVALRRSEIAALRVEDLRFTRQGMLVRIVRSKTDQTGEGVDLAVPRSPIASLCAVVAVRAYMEAAGITGGQLFRTLSKYRKLSALPLNGRDVANLIQRLVRRAGIEGDFSGHSLRSGFVTSAAEAKVSIDNIMRTTRHRSLAVLQGYIRRADAFDSPALSAIIG